MEVVCVRWIILLLILIVFIFILIFKKKPMKVRIAEYIMQNYIGDKEPPAEQIAGAIVQVSRKIKLDPILILTIIKKENPWFDPLKTGLYGEYGLMQILPSTFIMMEEYLNIECENSYDIGCNILVGSCYLKLCYKSAKDEGWKGKELLFHTFAKYNGGFARPYITKEDYESLPDYHPLKIKVDEILEKYSSEEKYWQAVENAREYATKTLFVWDELQKVFG